jgi:hypothetical protein
MGDFHRQMKAVAGGNNKGFMSIYATTQSNTTAQSTQAPATTGAAARCDAAQSSKVVVTFTAAAPKEVSIH